MTPACRDVTSATTTSSLPVIQCAMATQRPADVVGLHFFNPAPVMSLVEVVHTIRTSAQALATVRAVVAALGKTGVVCADRAGFVVNALLFPYLNDAVRMLEASYSTADDIDNAIPLCFDCHGAVQHYNDEHPRGTKYKAYGKI